MIETLKELCMLDGVSGRESAVRDYILNALSTYTSKKDVRVDALGNVIVHLYGASTASKTVMLAAHMDEVGVIATGITSDGFVRFTTVGGMDKAVLYGHRVRFGSTVGVIGGKAIHMCVGDEKEQIPEGDLLIDIGAADKEQAETLVQLGDVAVFDSDVYEIGHLLKGRAIDDRFGCAVLLELCKTTPTYDLWVVFTVQEEVGLRGAKTAAFAVSPDVAVVIDATTAADTVGVAKDKQVCRVGDGAVVSFMDRRTLYDKALYDQVLETAKELGIKAQPKSMVAGGNDAGAIQTASFGARVAAVSLPCRYIHSPSCMASCEDVQAVFALIKALSERLPQ